MRGGGGCRGIALGLGEHRAPTAMGQPGEIVLVGHRQRELGKGHPPQELHLRQCRWAAPPSCTPLTLRLPPHSAICFPSLLIPVCFPLHHSCSHERRHFERSRKTPSHGEVCVVPCGNLHQQCPAEQPAVRMGHPCAPRAWRCSQAHAAQSHRALPGGCWIRGICGVMSHRDCLCREHSAPLG